MYWLKFITFFLLSSYGFYSGFAQEPFENQKNTTRILFILDASGSMKANWQDVSKFEAATQILNHYIDSIQNSNLKVEFALRIFGHQSPRSEHNCEDSKLEVPFYKNNASEIKGKLSQIKPQGYTPIAYSLLQCLNDFPSRVLGTKNAIILITDAIEQCEGDLCEVGLELQKKRVAMKPFIIGMGLKDIEQRAFDCVGKYFNVENTIMLHNTLDIVISQAIHKTTTQVNLINKFDLPEETNIEMTFYDSYSKVIRYNLVHTMNADGLPDTLHLNPAGKYDLTVHSIPPVSTENIELNVGRHNIIGVDLPLGTLELSFEIPGKSSIKCVVSSSGRSVRNVSRQNWDLDDAQNTGSLHIQDINSAQKYLIGSYDLEFLSIPRKIFKNVFIEQSKTTEIKLPNPGTLNIFSKLPAYASIYEIQSPGYKSYGFQESRYVKIYEFNDLKVKATISMLPGYYIMVYRPKVTYSVASTKEKSFSIRSNTVTTLKF
ncbi:MAG: VWA domain-containing protein [Cytophagales bacterium]|nr:VWA domain-containing protein [Cytophagales bacterium]